MQGLKVKPALKWEVLTLDEALRSLDQLTRHVSIDTLICVLQKCRKSRDLEKAYRLLELIRRNGIESQLGNYLVPTLVECGSISSALDVLDRLIHPNVHSWTSLISGCAHGGFFQHAWKLYSRMQESCVAVNSYTLVALLKASLSLKHVQESHFEAVEKGFENDLFVGSTLVDSYVKRGALSEAHAVFNRMSTRNVVSWTALISGYADYGFGREAMDCYEQMLKQGFTPNDVTHIGILKACGNLCALAKGQEVHSEVVQKGLITPSLGSTIVYMYAKCGAVLEGHAVLSKLSVQDAVSWNALISGFAEYRLGHEALNCFEQMRDASIPFDAYTAVCILKACGDTGASNKGLDLHTEITLRSFEEDPFVGNALVDMYAKCGSLIEAQKVFDGLEVKDLVSWNAMLGGYAANNEGSKTLQFFKSMQRHGVKLDSITLTSILTACRHGNYAQRGLELFKLLTTNHGIVPTIDHFTCLVDLLSRSGQLLEAEKLLETMTGAESSKEMWLALLSACKRSSEFDIGLRCFEHLQKIDPECSTPYMLMANMYANTWGRQDAFKV